jgi:hypothetical protein
MGSSESFPAILKENDIGLIRSLFMSGLCTDAAAH